MDAQDIEDGEILEDECTVEQITNKHRDKLENPIKNYEYTNVVDKFFHASQQNNIDDRDSRKNNRRARTFSDGAKKRRRSDSGDMFRNEKYYSKKSKREDEDVDDEDMIFMLGGSLRDSERKMKNKKPMLPDLPDDRLNPVMYNEGENEDPRPYSRRSPIRRDKLKKERGLVRNVGLLKRRGRGGAMMRKEKPRETQNDMCVFFIQGHCQRGSECTYSHTYNQPRKLEVCKFYLNDCCTKRDKCIYMHSDFPCKYFHLPGLNCNLGKSCKFSHTKLDEIQRAVLKKYADIPIKEMDEMQKFYRDQERDRDRDHNCDRNRDRDRESNCIFIGRNKEKKDHNERIPSLFDIRVGYPTYTSESGEEGVREDVGITTPVPSPQSMMYENSEDDGMSRHLNKNYNHKVLSEYNDHEHEHYWEEENSANVHQNYNEETDHKTHHKKKSKKSEDFDDDKSRRHSEKKKKKSRKESKDDEKEKKKKKKERNRSKDQNEDKLRESFIQNDGNSFDTFDANDARETVDAFSHLPKKQQELFLRIQQHQKEAESSQNATVEDENNEDDPKADVNWYSSDEEGPETNQQSTSPLATLLRTLQTSTNQVPTRDKKTDDTLISSDAFASTNISAAADPVSIVDASQLANIDLSDEVAKNLTSIIQTVSTSSYIDTVSSSLPLDVEKDNLRKPFQRKNNGTDVILSLPVRKSSIDDNLRYSDPTSVTDSLFQPNDSPPKDIDVRQLPFKPIPVHDSANEIDASITSHRPIEYKLKALSYISKVDYSSMSEVSKMCVNDPRFKKKLTTAVQSTESTTETVSLVPTGMNVNDPRYLLSLKAATEMTTRTDPRLLDPRCRLDPRLDSKHVMTSVPATIGAAKYDPRIEKDFRDPRLSSRSKFPDPLPYHMAAVAAAAALVGSMPPVIPQMLSKETPSLRKEDPRLRFRANQNV